MFVADLTRNVIDISMEPLELEYEGVRGRVHLHHHHQIRPRGEHCWRAAIASRVVPYYFVVE
jgi:hypothetical protein